MESSGTGSQLRLTDGIRVDLERGEVLSDDARDDPVLRPQAERLLVVLARSAGRTVGKDELMEAVWPGRVVTDDSIVQAVRDIRKRLQDTDQTLVRTVRGRGYRLTPPAPGPRERPAAPLASAADAADGAPAVPVRQGRIGRRVPTLLVAMSALAVILVAWSLGAGPDRPESRPDATATDARPRIAVLPFAGDGTDPIGDWLAESLVRRLAENRSLWVVSHYSSFALRDAALSATGWRERLGVRYLVGGRVVREDDALRLDVVLTDLARDRVIWSRDYRTADEDISGMQRSVPEDLAGQLLTGARESVRQASLGAPAVASLDTYERTQRALALKHRFDPEATARARRELTGVLDEHPDHGDAWAALCWVNAVDGLFGLTGRWRRENSSQVVAQCRRAVELIPDSPMAHIALADAYSLSGELSKAADASAKSVRLAPGDGEAWLLHGLHLLPVASADAALDAIDRANALFPVKPPFVHLISAQVAWAAGELDAAREHADACLSAAPHLAMCHAVLALAAADAGEPAVRREQRELYLRTAGDVSENDIEGVCDRFAGEPGRRAACLSVLNGEA